MNNPINLFFSLVAITSLTIYGGFWISRHRSEEFTVHTLPWLISIGTGMLLAINFIELLPHSMEKSRPWTPIMIFVGIVSMILMEKYIAPKLTFLDRKIHHEHHEDGHHKNEEHIHHLISHQEACSSVGCLIVCAFFDGIEIASAFHVNLSSGWIVSSGLLFHVLPDGAIAAGMAAAGGLSIKVAKWSSLLIGGALFLGAITSIAVGSAIGFNSVVLPITFGVLTYVCLVHLLPMSLRHPLGLISLILSAALIFFFFGQNSHFAH
jgi:zinc transporter ZupT